MVLLHLNSFSAESTDAALLQRYPGSTLGGNKTYRDAGFQGEALTVRDKIVRLAVSQTVLRRSFGILSQQGINDTMILGFNLRVDNPKSNVPLLSIRQGGQEQLRVSTFRPPGTRNLQLHFVANSRLLHTTVVFDNLEWVHFELKVRFTTNGFIEFRVDGTTEVRSEKIDLTEGAGQAGWNEILISLQGENFNSFVSIDNLVVMDARAQLGSAFQLNDFIGPHIVDLKDVVGHATPVPPVNMIAGGSASDVQDGLDDSIDGAWDGDTAFAKGAIAITADEFTFSDAEFSNGNIKGVMVSFDARNEVGGLTFTQIVHYWLQGSFAGGTLKAEPEGIAVVTGTSYARVDLFINSLPNLFVSGIGGFPRGPLNKSNINGFGGIRFTLIRIPTLFAPDPTFRITSLFMEVLGTPVPEVIPAPLPPGTLYPAPLFRPNWRDGVKIETSWQTSIRRMKDTAAEERRNLSSRPIRTQMCGYTGLDQVLAQDLVHRAALRSTLENHPQPIWPDEMVISVATGQVTNSQLEVTVEDTRFRRLSRGQRLVISRRLSSRDRDYDATTWWSLDRWTQDKLFLIEERLPVGIIPDGGYAIGDRIFPCMDVETGTAQRVEMRSAEVGEHLNEITTELQGESTLPPVLDSITASPILSFNGIPLLELREDWSGGTPISVTRHGSKFPAGKGSVLDLDGTEPVYGFERSFTFLKREDWWSFLGLFDAMRGRTGTILVMAPQNAWEILDWNHLANILILAVPDWFKEEEFKDLYTHIGFQPSRLSFQKQTSILEIDTVTRVTPTILRITVKAGVVGFTRPSEIQRISTGHLVRFASDKLVEFWTNTSTVTVTARFESVEDETSKSVLNVIDNPAEKMEPDTLPDLFFWMDANKNAYQHNTLQDAFEHVVGWPHRTFRADVTFDARQELDKFIADPGFNAGGLPLPHMVGRLNDSRINLLTNDPWLTTFVRPHLLSGKKVFLGGPYQFGAHRTGYEDVPETEKVFWDNTDGMTIVVCWMDGSDLDPQGAGTVASNQGFLRVSDQSGNRIFNWSVMGTFFNNKKRGRIRLFRQPGNTATAVDLHHESWGRGTGTPIAAFRWRPGNAGRTQYFFKGIAEIVTASDSPIQMPIPFGPYFPEEQLQFFDRPPSVPQSNLADKYFEGFDDGRGSSKKFSGLLGVLIYKRALSNAEINIAANYFQEAYNGEWTNLP